MVPATHQTPGLWHRTMRSPLAWAPPAALALRWEGPLPDAGPALVPHNARRVSADVHVPHLWALVWPLGGGGSIPQCVNSRAPLTRKRHIPPPSSTAPAHQLLGSANAEMTPARAPAAAADGKQRPDATCAPKTSAPSRGPPGGGGGLSVFFPATGACGNVTEELCVLTLLLCSLVPCGVRGWHSASASHNAPPPPPPSQDELPVLVNGVPKQCRVSHSRAPSFATPSPRPGSFSAPGAGAVESPPPALVSSGSRSRITTDKHRTVAEQTKDGWLRRTFGVMDTVVQEFMCQLQDPMPRQVR